jgi:hypothetical protein
MTYHTANLQSCILYIYSTNIDTGYLKHGIFYPFFSSSKGSLFHISNVFGSCIIHILYTGCVKIKRNNSGAKWLKEKISHIFLANGQIKQVNWYLKMIHACRTAPLTSKVAFHIFIQAI